MTKPVQPSFVRTRVGAVRGKRMRKFPSPTKARWIPMAVRHQQQDQADKIRRRG